MIYDENAFKEKANRKARKIWIIFAVISDRFLYHFSVIVLAAADFRRNFITCERLGNRALPV